MPDRSGSGPSPARTIRGLCVAGVRGGRSEQRWDRAGFRTLQHWRIPDTERVWHKFYTRWCEKRNGGEGVLCHTFNQSGISMEFKR
jgi:hypothetical protein